MAVAAAAAGGGGAAASGGSGAAGAVGGGSGIGSLGLPGADLSALNTPLNLRTTGGPLNRALGEQAINDRVFDPKQHGYPEIPDVFGGPDIQLPFSENSPFLRQGPQSHGNPEEGEAPRFDSAPQNEEPSEPAPPEAKTPAQRRRNEAPEGRQNTLQEPDKGEPAPDERLEEGAPEDKGAAPPKEKSPPERQRQSAPEGGEPEASPDRPRETAPDERRQFEGPPGADGKGGAPEGTEPGPEERRNEGDRPFLTGKTDAFATGATAGFFGITVDEMMELSMWFYGVFGMHGDKPGADEEVQRARDQFREFSEAAGNYALRKDEDFGTAGMVAGGGGTQLLSPGGKVKAAGAGAKGGATIVKTVVGAVTKKAKKGAKTGTKGGKKAAPKTAKKPPKDPPDFERFDDMVVVPGMERHHVALKAIFRRSKDPAVQSILRELRAYPLSPNTHRALHKIVNNRLKREGLMPGSAARGGKEVFTKKDVQRALKVLEDEYRKEGVHDFADHIQGMRNAMRNARLFD